MKTSLCHCGGSHSQVEDKRRRLCQRQNCPRATLGQGSWRLALPKLRALHDEGELFEHFPELNIRKLEEHVARAKGTSRRRSHRRIRCRYSVDRKNPGERSRSQRRESALQRATSSSSPKFRISADSVASSSGLQLSPLEATQQGASSSSRDNTVNLSQIKDDNRKAQRDVTPVNRYSEDNRSYDNLTSLCSSQYSHLSLLVMKELVKDAVQSVTFNAWVNFAGGRIARRLRKSLALVSRAIHAPRPPQSLFAAHREVTPHSHIGVFPQGGAVAAKRRPSRVPYDDRPDLDAKRWERHPPRQHPMHDEAESYWSYAENKRIWRPRPSSTAPSDGDKSSPTFTPSPSARTGTPAPSARVGSDDPSFVAVSSLSFISNQDKQQPFSSIGNPVSCSRREFMRNMNRASSLRTTSTGFDVKD